MIVSTSIFIQSTLGVSQNAVKNILFRAATILLELVVLKLFAYIAFRSRSYTSYLMFAEGMVQKALFVVSRKLNRQAMIVLLFAMSITAVGFYDTLLWALDSPGYVYKTITTPGTSIASKLVANPGYISTISNVLGGVTAIDLDQALTGNLFQPGLNFTFPRRVEPGSRDVVAPVHPMVQGREDDFLDGDGITVSPRIWLDATGFSVGVNPTGSLPCILQTTADLSQTIQTWNCVVNSTDIIPLFTSPFGQPTVWWDASQRSELLAPSRRENPWGSLGKGGDTAVMRQVFTATKGNRRHTFLENSSKVTMITTSPDGFDKTELEKMIRRAWPAEESTLPYFIGRVESAQTNKTGVYMGAFTREDYSVSTIAMSYLSVPETGSNGTLYSAFQVLASNTTLIRSETLPESVEPFAPCDRYFTNSATGGRVDSTTCYKSISNQTGAHFLGQLDTSAVLIITSILGDGSKSTSDAALNQTGLDWLTKNSDRIDDLLTSRALILGGDNSAVYVSVTHTEAAISYLQLLLVLFPIVLAAFAYGFVAWQPMAFYKTSFLSAVAATTHIDGKEQPESCEKPGYLKAVPEISLRRSGGHVVLETPNGVLAVQDETAEKHGENVPFAQSVERVEYSPGRLT